MTKILQWVTVTVVLLAVWIALLTDKTPFKLAEAGKEVVWVVSTDTLIPWSQLKLVLNRATALQINQTYIV